MHDFDFIRISYESGERKEGYLVDMSNGIGVIQGLDGSNTAFFAHEVILDVLHWAEPTHGSSLLPLYPFEQGDRMIFQQRGEYLHGRFVRKGSFGFLYVTSAEGENYCIDSRAIRRLASPALTFDIPFPFLTNGKKEQSDHAE